MKPLTLQINARRFKRDEHHAILLDDDAPSQPLRLALIIRGSEQHVFPALALDDWGREKKGTGLFRWLYEEGPRFPRAEVFGFDAEGAQTQIFLRDLELSFRYPCFVYEDPTAPVEDGRRLHTIFIASPLQQPEPVKIKPPKDLPWSIRHAAVRWRQTEVSSLAGAGWERMTTGN